MSHVAKIELEINDLDALKAACKRLGLEFLCNQKTFAWYGAHVGDYPIPEGLTIQDMGKCDHAIQVPGAKYEIGVLKRTHGYALLWDFYSEGGLEQKIGRGAGRLKQAYAIERVKREARLKNMRVRETKTAGGIRLTLSD